MGHSKDKWATVAKSFVLVPHGLNFLSKGQHILQLFSELATIYSLPGFLDNYVTLLRGTKNSSTQHKNT